MPALPGFVRLVLADPRASLTHAGHWLALAGAEAGFAFALWRRRVLCTLMTFALLGAAFMLTGTLLILHAVPGLAPDAWAWAVPGTVWALAALSWGGATADEDPEPFATLRAQWKAELAEQAGAPDPMPATGAAHVH
jgi:hypothetical protein